MKPLARRIAAVALGAGVALTAVLGPTAAQAAPAPLAQAAGSASTLLGSPSADKLDVTGHRQATNYYCVPASAQFILNSFGIPRHQSTLADKMGTTKSAGTSGNAANKVINAYINPKGYRIDTRSASNPTTLLSMVRYDIGTLHRAPYIGVWMEDLPWNKGKGYGNNTGHGIAVYGYNATKGTITVYDPWKPTGGPHTLTAKQLSAASQQNGGLHYISRI